MGSDGAGWGRASSVTPKVPVGGYAEPLAVAAPRSDPMTSPLCPEPAVAEAAGKLGLAVMREGGREERGNRRLMP